MRLLLDTIVFLWYISDDTKLPVSVRATIADKQNEVFLSSCSVWEAVTKQSLGKIVFPKNAGVYFEEQRIKHQISPLPINNTCLKYLYKLPLIHNDPFDRILICQAIDESLTIVTADFNIKKYKVQTIPV